MGIPVQVGQAVGALLDELDAVAPGLIDAVYVTGSVALDDFQPDISDIDAVVVTARRLNERDVEALSSVHKPARPHIDVLYVTAEELRSDPAEATGAHSHEGVFNASGAFAANPVEWRTLQTSALTLRGPQLTPEDVWFDPRTLQTWNAENLDAYWSGRLNWLRSCEPTEAIMRWEYGLQWIVLGIPRLHHTIATLEITSKTGAGRYALEISDDCWHPVIEACIALRRDRNARLSLGPDRLRADAVELAGWLIEDGTRLAR